jgi:hypothetical protein
VLIGRERTGMLLLRFRGPPTDCVTAPTASGSPVRRSHATTIRDAGRTRDSRGRGRIGPRCAAIPLERWLRDYLSPTMTTLLRSRLLPGQSAGGVVARGRIVCGYFDVAESDVRGPRQPAFEARGALAEVSSGCAGWTNCGSCLPELRRLVADARLSGRRLRLAITG